MKSRVQNRGETAECVVFPPDFTAACGLHPLAGSVQCPVGGNVDGFAGALEADQLPLDLPGGDLPPLPQVFSYLCDLLPYRRARGLADGEG